MTDLRTKLEKAFNVTFTYGENEHVSYVVNFTVAKNIHNAIVDKAHVITFTDITVNGKEVDVYIFTDMLEMATIQEVKK